MWSVARTRMGMTRQEFLSSTPKEFDAFCRLLEASDRKQQFNAALICSVLANINRDPQKRSQPFSPQDFMPQAEEIQTDEQQVKMLSIIFGCGPGMKSKEPSRKPYLRPKVKHG